MRRFGVGVHQPAEARKIAFGSLTRLSPGKDAVRHVQVGKLRSAGFRVEHTPRLGGSLHVSAFWDETEEWNDTVENLLHSCCMEGVI